MASHAGYDDRADLGALTYAQMVDGFWIGWLMDREAYSLDEATACVSDWVLSLFGERTPVTRKQTPAKSAAAAPGARKKPARK